LQPPSLLGEHILTDTIFDLASLQLHARVHSTAKPSAKAPVYHAPDGKICLDEVEKSLHMPAYNAKIASCRSRHDDIAIPEKAVNQLREFITVISSMYRSNPFHNFEHACHVTMSVKKLLNRVVAPELTPEQFEKLKNNQADEDLACHIHEYTYGINSEPLVLLSLTFAALIHGK